MDMSTAKWEGPCWLVQVSRPNAVRLDAKDGVSLANSWSIENLQKHHLHKFYP